MKPHSSKERKSAEEERLYFPASKNAKVKTMFDLTSFLWIGLGAGSLMMAFATYAAAYRKSLKVKEAQPGFEVER